ncbi:MAG: hypothetical protein GXP42_07910 [Chloroflexi bacterium]|nr:hypothetical protein [Chloroflexota bacterium]
MSNENPLTRRETEVLGLLAEGLSNDEIATRLVISPNTVKVHVRNIFEKMGVQSRTEATMEAVRRGWISVPGLAAGAAETKPAPPKWEPVRDQWRPWRTVVLLAAIALALLMALWPNRSMTMTPARGAAFTTDMGAPAVAILPRKDAPRWASMPPMFTPRSRAAGGVVDGRLYVVGGENESGDVAVMEVYDPLVEAWQSLAPRAVAARNAAAAGLENYLYVVGGCAGEQALARVDRYDPERSLWESVAALPEPRCGLALVAMEGRLYAMGGWDGASMTDTLFIYDAAANRWEEGRRLPEPRGFGAAVALRDRIYLAGGRDDATTRAEMWTYDPVTDSWLASTALPEPRAGLALAAEGSSVYAIGGGNGAAPHLHERFDLNTQAWSTFDSPRSGPWRFPVATIIGPNLHVVGGWAGDYLAVHEVYQASHLLFLPLGAQGAK